MILAAHGIRVSRIALIRESKATPRHGTRRAEMTRCLRRYGVEAIPDPRGTLKKLQTVLRREGLAIINYVEPTDEEGHYAIVTAQKGTAFLLHDPWNGEDFRITEDQMKQRWLGHRTGSKTYGWMLVIEEHSSRGAERRTGTRSRR